MHKERVSEECVTCQVARRLSLADETQGHKELTPEDGLFLNKVVHCKELLTVVEIPRS